MSSAREKEQARAAFAARFRDALAELGFTGRETGPMHELFGVSGQAVRKWAQGEALPTASRMPHVAAVLGVRRAWLQDGEGPMRPAVGVAEPEGVYRGDGALTPAPEEAKLLVQYRLLQPRQKKIVRELLALFVEAAKGTR
ncbi:MAG TPA: hypothetical protein ENJ19_03575 [Gammaproteobacteria bacterium]|nr:hypothetical protein [Gammaproteobacteria bacterium]